MAVQADLGDLDGLASGLKDSPMIDGGEFDGAKAYKDSKVSSNRESMDTIRTLSTSEQHQPLAWVWQMCLKDHGSSTCVMSCCAI